MSAPAPVSARSRERARPGSGRPTIAENREGRRRISWSGLGFVVVYLLCVRTQLGQLVDEEAMLRLSTAAGSVRWAQLVGALVSAPSLLAVTAGLLLVTALLRGRRTALVSAGAAATILVAAQLLKLLLDRPSLLSEAMSNSFPSGHTAAVAGVAAVLVIAVPVGWRWVPTILVAVPAVSVMGLATIVLQWHRPSDVLGSALLAVLVTQLAITFLAREPGASRREAAQLRRL